MRYLLILLVLGAVSLASCDQMEERETVEKEMQEKMNSQTQENHDGHHHNAPGHTHDGESVGDAEADRLMKEADVSYAAFKQSKSDNDKKDAIKKSMDAGMYLTYDAQLPPKDKYKPALKYFRIVLSLDPANEEAKVNKDKIEEIYEQMGKPIPETEI